MMMLVIDVTKGMQTQSAECLVIGQIACQKLVVVLNKTDLLPEGKRQAAIDRMTRKMQKTLENTKWVCRRGRGRGACAGGQEPGGRLPDVSRRWLRQRLVQGPRPPASCWPAALGVSWGSGQSRARAHEGPGITWPERAPSHP